MNIAFIILLTAVLMLIFILMHGIRMAGLLLLVAGLVVFVFGHYMTVDEFDCYTGGVGFGIGHNVGGCNFIPESLIQAGVVMIAFGLFALLIKLVTKLRGESNLGR